MNKMIKLPLFLGVCGAACAGILAGVFAFTDPIIKENAEKAANAAIYAAFETYGNQDTLKVSNGEISETLKSVGVTSKKVVTGDSLTDGAVYQCTTATKGYSGYISFQVTFAEGKFLSYTDLGNSETKTLISEMNGLVSGALAANYDFAIKAGETYTSKAIKTAIDAIAKDYAG